MNAGMQSSQHILQGAQPRQQAQLESIDEEEFLAPLHAPLYHHPQMAPPELSQAPSLQRNHMYTQNNSIYSDAMGGQDELKKGRLAEGELVLEHEEGTIRRKQHKEVVQKEGKKKINFQEEMRNILEAQLEEQLREVRESLQDMSSKDAEDYAQLKEIEEMC